MKIPIRPAKLPEINDLAGKPNPEALLRTLRLAGLRLTPRNRGRYLPWDDLPPKPAPNGLSPEDHWLAVRFARRASSRALPFADVKGTPFTLSQVPALSELLHEIDRNAAGAIDASAGVASAAGFDRYLMTSLFEEAITSSQLEGASTTRNAIALLEVMHYPDSLVADALAVVERQSHSTLVRPAHAAAPDPVTSSPET